MSTSVNLYAVQVDRLRKVPGSKNRTLLTSVKKQKDFLEMVDEIREDFDEDDEDDEEEEEEGPPSCAEAVKQIINGEPYDDEFGYVYGYAYEALCKTIGAEVEPSWSSISGFYEWFEDIDKALASLGTPLKVMDLCYRGPLFEVPPPDDFPGMGWWTADEVAEAARLFKGIDLTQLDRKTAKKVAPVADAIEDIRSWINLAAKRRGHWLIGVHS